MNTRRELDRIVIDWLQDRTVDPPHDGLREALERVAVTPQQRYGRLAAVLDHVDELLRGPDPFTSRGSWQRLALSAASVAAAVAVFGLVVALFLPSLGQDPRLGPAGVATHVVATDGSGDFGTIGEAVVAADEGDRIVIEPGTYTESVVIDKDIELTGDPHDGSAVVVQVPGDGPLEDTGWADLEPMRYGFLLRDSAASIRHLTIGNTVAGTAAIIVDGGAPVVSDLVAEMRYEACVDRFVLVGGGAAGTIERSTSNACIDIYDAASPTVGDNVLGASIAVGDRGSAPVLVGNQASWILVDTDASATIEDNDVGGGHGYAVEVGGPGASATIRGNTIHDSGFGISVYAEATATISGNTLRGNDMGVTISSSRSVVRDNDLVDNGVGIRVLGAAELVEGNRVTGGTDGILVSGSGKARLIGNSVEGATRGVVIERWASPTLEGNRLCGNEVDLWLAEGASPEIGENDICGVLVDPDAAGTAATHVVAADGSGDVITISEAVARASDGDRIVIEPGTYAESVLVDKDVEIIGDESDPSAVVVRVPDDGPAIDVGPYSLERMRYAFLLDGSDATIGHLSIDGPHWYTAAIIVDGGEPTIHDVAATVMDLGCESGFVFARGGAGGTIRDNRSNGGVFITQAASPLVTGNTLGGVSVVDTGSAPAIRANHLGPVSISNGAAAVVEDNDAIAQESGCAMAVYAAGTSAVIRGNRIEGGSHGICIHEGATVTVEGNTLGGNMAGIDIAADDVVAMDNELTDNDLGISISAADARVEGNRVTGGRTGVVVSGAAAPSVVGNSISEAGRGIAVGRSASPVLRLNDLCGNLEDFWIAEGASPRLEANTVCGVATSELAPAPVTHVVAADGSGDFTTISEAVAAATDGDTVRVAVGIYEDALVIDKDIILEGSGAAPGDVIVDIAPDPPTPATPVAAAGEDVTAPATPPYPSIGIQVLDSDATFRNLQLRGRGDGVVMLVRGGSPALHDVILGHDVELGTGAELGGSLFIDGAAVVELHGGEAQHRVRVSDASTLSLSDVTLTHLALELQGASTLVVDEANVSADCYVPPIQIVDASTAIITGSRFHGGGVAVHGDGAAATLAGNSFLDACEDAILVTDGALATIRDNEFIDARGGVDARHASPAIMGNTFRSTMSGIALTASDALVEANTFRNGGNGIATFRDGSATLAANVFEEGRGFAISVGAGTSPTVEGNTCVGQGRLRVDAAAAADLGANEGCAVE